MQPVLTFLGYLAIGLALYFVILGMFNRKFLWAFPVFLVAGTVITCIGLADSYWVAYKGALPTPLSLLLGITGKTFRIMLGYCLGYWLAGFLPRPGVRDDVEQGRQIDYLVRALSIQIGLVFVSAFIGKTLNMQEMSRFFRSSGYTIPFLYFIMALEGGFGLLLLFNLKFYPKMTAIVLLFAVMVGAVVTHARNRDPLSDSGAAILLGTDIVLLAAVYLSRPGALAFRGTSPVREASPFG